MTIIDFGSMVRLTCEGGVHCECKYAGPVGTPGYFRYRSIIPIIMIMVMVSIIIYMCLILPTLSSNKNTNKTVNTPLHYVAVINIFVCLLLM